MCGCKKNKAAEGVAAAAQATEAPVAKVPVTYTGEAKLPRLETGPVSGKRYLLNPGRLTIRVDQADAAAFVAVEQPVFALA